MAKQTNSAYWAKRRKEAQRFIDKNLKDDAKMAAHLQQEWAQASKNIQAEIDRQYMNYASAEGMTMADAMKAVSLEDVQAFAEEAAQLVNGMDFSDEANARLKLYNATMRINRLEYLKAKIGLEMTKQSEAMAKELSGKVSDAYRSERKRQSGILSDYAQRLDPNRPVKTLLKQYNADGFSESVWKNQDLIKSKLDNDLTQAMVRGINPRVVGRKLRPLVQDSMKSAGFAGERIARTEMARAQIQAQLDSFKDNGIDKVELVAEPGACSICRKLDGKVFNLDDAPDIPLHPNCRCSYAAHPDWEAANRLADEYQAEAESKTIEGEATKKPPRKAAAKKDSLKSLRKSAVEAFDKTNARKMFGEERYKQFTEALNGIKDEKMLKLYAKFGPEMTFNQVMNIGAHANGNRVYLSPSSFTGDKISTPMQAVFHEAGHAIDNLTNMLKYGMRGQDTGLTTRIQGTRIRVFSNAISGDPAYKLASTIKQDMWKFGTDGKYPSPRELGPRPRKKAEKAAWLEKNNAMNEGSDVLQKKVASLVPESRTNPRAWSDVSDIAEGTKMAGFAPWGAGHSSGYWNDYGKLETEFIAEYTSAKLSNPESYAKILEIFPNASKVAEQILSDMLEVEGK